MRLERATKRFRDIVALNEVTLSFERGSVCAVMGANGSGKSTLARALAGTLALDSGTRTIEEGARVGYMPQRSYAFYGTVARNVALGAPSGSFDVSCRSLLRDLGLEALSNSKAKKLSGGETARMSLARVLAGAWDYLVLDEPTASLDIPSTLAAERLVRAYCDDRRAGVVVVTHSIGQARRIADRIVFMDGGSVIEDGAAVERLDAPKTNRLREFIEVLGA